MTVLKNDVTNELSQDDTTESILKDANNDWVYFAKNIAIYFVLTVFLGIYGSGFIYLTTRNKDLDLIFPTDDAFYSAKSCTVDKSGPANIDDGCNGVPVGSYSVLEPNFPYNLIDQTISEAHPVSDLKLINRFTNWFARTVAGTFKQNRALIKDWLDFFRPNSPLGSHTFQIFVAAPFTGLVSMISLIPGFFSAFGAAISSDITLSVWGIFLFYFWGLCGGLAFLIFARLVTTLLFFPMSQNWKEVSSILACNAKSLIVMFGFFVCGAAYDALDPVISGIMGIVYLLLVMWTVWKSYKS